ncbi:MAG TPA: penicillin-binding protein 2 [Candidatus Sabulitectum sp.]|nr:penicillin-binding protein 2 [Candidatus Sabulitectum sp.]
MRTRTGIPERPFRSMLLLAVILFAILAGRLFHLQIVSGDYYRELSSRNHIRSVITPAPRGIITDRNGVVLADNVPSFTVSVVSAEFDTLNTGLLLELLDMEAPVLSERMASAASSPFRSTVIASGLDVASAGRVADNLYRLGGVSVTVLPRRRYSMGESFCHLVGYVGLSDSTGTFEGEIVGRTGLERLFDDHLSGKHGVIREVVDAHGRLVERFSGGEVSPVPGEDLRLTLDSRLQRAADSLLEATGYSGAVVVINYQTGEILCLSSVPGYDTNLFIGGISREDWNTILQDPDRPLINRSWATVYPPGSTFKTVSASWLLQSGIVTRDYMPDPCYRTFRFAGSDFRCWTTHGRLNIVDALAQSCDTYFYRTTMEADVDQMAFYARSFGLGSRITDILPAEAEGTVPDRNYLNSLFGRGGWGQGNLMIASIGQGELLATPLQVAVTSGLIASDFAMPPLTAVQGADPPEPPWEASVSEENLQTVRDGMLAAVRHSRGTLHSTMGYLTQDVWAKSGTAENSSGEDHAWVTGFIEEPIPIAFAVIVENGGHGSLVAGPVAAGLIERIGELYP